MLPAVEGPSEQPAPAKVWLRASNPVDAWSRSFSGTTFTLCSFGYGLDRLRLNLLGSVTRTAPVLLMYIVRIDTSILPISEV
jgi:hypothetical protein